MSDDVFDVDAWLPRVGHDGPREPLLSSLRAVIAAHTATIPFEIIDILLGRPPKLDLAPLQRKMIAGGRGGYCFAQNTLLLAGLGALGFRATGPIGCVIRGIDADASEPATHSYCELICRKGRFWLTWASATRRPPHRSHRDQGWSRRRRMKLCGFGRLARS
jgi:N-hydroxyarylamine O-acetyltransferase